MSKVIFTVLLTIFLFSCSDSTGPDSPQTVDELIRSAGLVNTEVEAKEELLDENEKTIEEKGQKYKLVEKKYSLARNLDDEIIPFNNPNANSLWAGAIVKGGEVPNGELSSIGDDIERQPLTITAKSGDQLFGSATINNPSNEDYSAKMQEILENVSVNTSAEMHFNQKIAYSKEQSLMEMGIGFSWLPTSMSAKFETNQTSYKKDVFLYFKQVYYTVSVNEPSKPSKYFGDDVKVEDLESLVDNNNPFCYVSSVTYGRLIMAKMTYEGTASGTDVEASLGNFLSTLVDASGGYHKDEIIENSEFTGYVLGGSSEDGANALTGGLEGIIDLIQNGAEYKAGTPAHPIAYTVRNLADNSIVKLGETTEYTVKEYEPIDPDTYDIEIEFDEIEVIKDCDSGGDGEYFYDIQLYVKNGNEEEKYIGSVSHLQQYGNDPIDVGSGGTLKLNKIFNFTINNKKESYIKIYYEIIEEDSFEDEIIEGSKKFIQQDWNEIFDENTTKVDYYFDNNCNGTINMKINKR